MQPYAGTTTDFHPLQRKSEKDSACTFATLLPAKKGDWNVFHSIKGNDVEYSPGLLFCAKDGENSPAFVPSKDWEHSERGDSLAFFRDRLERIFLHFSRLAPPLLVAIWARVPPKSSSRYTQWRAGLSKLSSQRCNHMCSLGLRRQTIWSGCKLARLPYKITNFRAEDDNLSL